MNKRFAWRSCAALVFALLSFAGAAAQDIGPQCTDCHNPKISEPIRFMLGSAHWDKAQSGTPVNENGCASCHGPSDAHRKLPTQPPDVSFGPKLRASIADQNGQCLACHTKIGTGWADGKHARVNLACTTCHEAHKSDQVLAAAGQVQTCTMCHRLQLAGVHGLGDRDGRDPPCAQCHDPHANPSPEARLLASRSKGCRACHDLAAMAADSRVSETAKSYHKIVASPDRTCIDCHRGVIHPAHPASPGPTSAESNP